MKGMDNSRTKKLNLKLIEHEQIYFNQLDQQLPIHTQYLIWYQVNNQLIERLRFQLRQELK